MDPLAVFTIKQATCVNEISIFIIAPEDRNIVAKQQTLSFQGFGVGFCTRCVFNFLRK